MAFTETLYLIFPMAEGTPDRKLKPFEVTLETSIVVLAETKDAAVKWTRDNFQSLSSDDLSKDHFSISATPFRAYPGGWGPDCIPYGGDRYDDTQLGEILANDPEYQQRLAERPRSAMSADDAKCPHCHGRGWVVIDLGYSALTEGCASCKGTGRPPSEVANGDKTALASASGYAGWVLMVREGKEPVGKRCSSDDEAWKMITALEERNPEAKVIHLQTNPGDPRELWAQSSRNFWATTPRHNDQIQPPRK